ncbi:hypothetical protein JCM8097_009032 [Rhodosporidiobolus ruineniae]
MSSSTSSAVAAEGGTVNEEVKNREESVEEVEPSSPFDRLPDEILVDILRAATDDEGWWRGRAPLLALNRRLRYLAQPLWFSSYPFSSMECGIVRHPVYLGLVKHLRDGAIQEYLWQKGLPRSITRSLRSFKHLKRLNLEPVYNYNLEDREFNIAREAPQLDGLTVQGPTTGVRQLLTPLPPLQHLCLYNIQDTEVYRYLPWSTLVSLVLLVGIVPISDLLRPLDAVNQSLEGALFPSPLDLANLNRLVDSFPNLLSLSIADIYWSSVTAWQDEMRWGRDFTALLEDHPTLTSFLDSLSRSSVLSFDFSPDFGEDEYRFVRVKRGEGFQVDRYPKVQKGDGYVFG